MIRIGQCKVNGVLDSSFVSVGPHLVTSAETFIKRTIGHSSVQGDGSVAPTLWGTIQDSDLLDTPIWVSTGSA